MVFVILGVTLLVCLLKQKHRSLVAQLKNGIHAVLIHDPSLLSNKTSTAKPGVPSKNEWLPQKGVIADADDDDGGMAAAAAAVQIGSFSDPMKLQVCAVVAARSVCVLCD